MIRMFTAECLPMERGLLCGRLLRGGKEKLQSCTICLHSCKLRDSECHLELASSYLTAVVLA